MLTWPNAQKSVFGHMFLTPPILTYPLPLVAHFSRPARLSHTAAGRDTLLCRDAASSLLCMKMASDEQTSLTLVFFPL